MVENEDVCQCGSPKSPLKDLCDDCEQRGPRAPLIIKVSPNEKGSRRRRERKPLYLLRR